MILIITLVLISFGLLAYEKSENKKYEIDVIENSYVLFEESAGKKSRKKNNFENENSNNITNYTNNTNFYEVNYDYHNIRDI